MKTQTINKVLQFLLIGSFISTAFFGCTKEDEIDGPGTDPEVPGEVEVNSSISEILAMYAEKKQNEDDFFEVTEEMTFTGTVISSDEARNVRNYITVQDENGKGIQVKIYQDNIYQSFPQGRQVLVKAQGMYVGNYGGLVQLGGLYNDGFGSLDAELVPDHITLVEGEVSMPTPTALDLAAENIEDLYNTLVKVSGVQFVEEGVTFSEADFDTNLDLVNKDGKKIILRTSKSSHFAADTIPSKSGDITAILTGFRGASQLTLVSKDDLQFNADRFEVEIKLDGEGTLEKPYSVEDAIQLQGLGEEGWVVGYIVGYIPNSDSFQPGTDGATAFSIAIATSEDETAKEKVLAVRLTGHGYIQDNLNLSDNPSNHKQKVWIKGAIKNYHSMQGLRDLISYSVDGVNEVEPDPDYDGEGDDINGAEMTATSINFSTYNVASFSAWETKDQSAFINAYGKGKSEAWMISKEKLTLEGTEFETPRLVVSEMFKYFSEIGHVQILLSSDYTGTGNPNVATWTAATFDEVRNEGNDVENTLNISFSGQQYVAFKYTSVDGTSGGSMQWLVKSVAVKEKEGEEPIDPELSPGVNLGDKTVSGFSDLIFSEYVEGSSNNKYLEIFNGTGADVDLSEYSIKIMSNANLEWGTTTTLEGTLPNGATFVIAHNQAVLELPAGVSVFESGNAVNFNGDDRVAIFKGDTEIDRIGFIDLTNPESPVRVNFGKDVTFQRNGEVRAGVVGDNDPRENGQWTALDKDDVSGLGSHTVN
ncbi:DUF5689 domain-containing protein [Flammeovirga aprica]|uniref:Lamin tail domain-containing protein n=1 Tax=Flammeovirga aprica JL-4 TaxID=694437 RepID=A0A7X9RS57_9BACT|nr:DUF5689 domain-containing protein [Flammeovirga aprica]NME66631.1 lamin tail domain-containing protein [Flammeovirga aprica JL-4]